ncbi:MAG: hypothetical protein JWM59_2967 [Verrucomicrobiales bacterium]|nr:hypothetical protein [Verrucomicrobiales bacterium]
MEKVIYLHISGSPSQWGPVILDQQRCERILAIAVETGLAPPGKAFSSTINNREDHPGWEPLFSALKEEGWTPYYGYAPPHLLETHFNVRTVVKWSRTELDAAELLRLGDGWGRWHITGFAGRNGKRWVGYAQGVGKSTRQYWQQSHGVVDGWHNYFIHPKVRAYFENQGLELDYHPLEWDHPERARGAFWEIDTPHVMPPCLLPVVQDEMGTRFYEDRGYDPPELRFPRCEVEAMGSFDAAWTREEIGVPGPRDSGHLLVVSQRFRWACLEYGLKNVPLYPVRLV